MGSSSSSRRCGKGGGRYGKKIQKRETVEEWRHDHVKPAAAAVVVVVVFTVDGLMQRGP
jgi:hypothetical protein